MPIARVGPMLGQVVRNEMKKSTLIKIELARPEVQPPSLTQKDSWLFSSLTVYRANHIIGFAVEGFPKGENYAKIFPDLAPRSNGVYELELGATLPEMLPNLNEMQEYSLRVRTKDSSEHVYISNRMRRIDFVLDGAQHFGIYPIHGEKTFRDKFPSIPTTVPAVPVNSTASMRFKISGSNAEEALEQHVERCIKKFVLCLNRILTTCYSLDEDDFGYFSLQFSQTSFPWFYIMMKGASRKLMGFDRIASHAGRVALTTKNFSADKLAILEKALLESPDRLDPRRFLSSARVASMLGLEQLALLQSVIASEMATGHYIREKLQKAGVSKNKWDNHKNEIRYSQMLDILLPALTPKDKRPSPEIIGSLNRARTLRNSLMHEGNEAIGDGEIKRLIQAASHHLDYLESVGKINSISKKQKPNASNNSTKARSGARKRKSIKSEPLSRSSSTKLNDKQKNPSSKIQSKIDHPLH